MTVGSLGYLWSGVDLLMIRVCFLYPKHPLGKGTITSDSAVREQNDYFTGQIHTKLINKLRNLVYFSTFTAK